MIFVIVIFKYLIEKVRYCRKYNKRKAFPWHPHPIFPCLLPRGSDFPSSCVSFEIYFHNFQIICFCELITFRYYRLLNVKDEDFRCLTSPLSSLVPLAATASEGIQLPAWGSHLNLSSAWNPCLIHAPGPLAQRPLVQPFQRKRKGHSH